MNTQAICTCRSKYDAVINDCGAAGAPATIKNVYDKGTPF